jgi:putative ABC transport system permease protein
MVRPGQRMGPGSGGGAPQFKEADAGAIASQIGGVAAVAPEARAGVTVVANGRNWATSVTGSTNDWFITGNWKLWPAAALFRRRTARRRGRVHHRRNRAPRAVRRRRGQHRPGRSLRIKQFSCEVIGVLASKGQGGMGDQDDMVLVPLHTLQRRVTGNNRSTRCWCR